MNRTRRLPAIGAATLIAATLALAGCTSSSGHATHPAAATTGSSYLPAQPKTFASPTPGTALGTQEEAIPTTVPQKITVNGIPAFTGQEMVVAEPYGSQLTGYLVVNPKTGKNVAVIDSADVNFWPMPFAITGTHKSLPNFLAAEDWRPRGLRGKADHVVSYYSGQMLSVPEISLPDDTRFHAQNESAAITSDGRYLVAWDDAVFGIRVIDLQTKRQTGELRLVGCGPFPWMVGHTMYSLCASTRSVVQVSIDANGVPHQTASKQVFGVGFLGSRDSAWAGTARTALWISPRNEVYRLDLSSGLPASTVPSAGILPLPKDATAGTPVMTADGKSFAVPVSQDDNTTEIRVFDTATLKLLYTYSAKQYAAGGSLKSVSYSSDSATLYLLSTRTNKDQIENVLTGFSAATGKQVSQAVLTKTLGATDDLSGLWAPMTVSGP